MDVHNCAIYKYAACISRYKHAKGVSIYDFVFISMCWCMYAYIMYKQLYVDKNWVCVYIHSIQMGLPKLVGFASKMMTAFSGTQQPPIKHAFIHNITL